MRPFVSFTKLTDLGDLRGLSYNLDTRLAEHLTSVRSCHVATISPGKSRGNHFHSKQTEIIFVFAGARWSLHWDEGPNTSILSEAFSGKDAILVMVFPTASHALKNIDDHDLVMIALTDQPYQEEHPDAIIRNVL